MVLPVTEENLIYAAEIHAASWQDSHKSFCSPSFVEEHTVRSGRPHICTTSWRRESACGSCWIQSRLGWSPCGGM